MTDAPVPATITWPIVRRALQQWRQVDAPVNHTLATLFLFRRYYQANGGLAHLAQQQLLLEALTLLQQHHADAADLLRYRYLKGYSVRSMANRRNLSVGTIYARQRLAFTQLTELIQQQEQTAHTAHLAALQRRLPPAVDAIGVDEQSATLADQIAAPDGPWLMALTGAPGIGKSTLLRHSIARLIIADAVDEVIWIDAACNSGSGTTCADSIQPPLTTMDFATRLAAALCPLGLHHRAAIDRNVALRRHLATARYVIVIDNLHTARAVATLVPTIQALANPTKFILTTRHAPSSHPALYQWPVADLADDAARKVLRRTAPACNLPHLAWASEQELTTLAAAVGKVPRALLLAVGLLHFAPLPTLLADLQTKIGREGTPTCEVLYTLLWQRLTTQAQWVLTALLFVAAPGIDLPGLSQLCGMAVAELRQILAQLVNYNLVNGTGTLGQRRYSINDATHTFVRAQVTVSANPRVAPPFQQMAERLLDLLLSQIHSDAAPQPDGQLRHGIGQIISDQRSLTSATWRALRTLLLAVAPHLAHREQGAPWVALLYRALQVSDRQQDRQASAELALRLGQLLQAMHFPDEAKRCIAHSRQHAVAMGDTEREAQALNQLAHLACEEQHYEEAEQLARKANTLVQRTSTTYAMSVSVLALTHLLRNALPAAEMFYRQALDLWSAQQIAQECARSLHNLGYLFVLQHRPWQAIVYYEDALGYLPDQAEPAYRAMIQAQLAFSYILVGDHQQGLVLLTAAEPIVRRLADDELLAYIWLGQGECYLALQQEDWAAVAFAQSAHFSASACDDRVYHAAYSGINAISRRH